MRLFAVRDGASDAIATRVRLLTRADASRGVEYVDLDASALLAHEVPRPQKGDIVYRVSRGGQLLENLLLSSDVSSFYRHLPVNVDMQDATAAWTMLHERAGIPGPRTVHEVRNSRTQLDAAVTFVGGYPVVAKVVGGTLGVGVLLAESSAALYAIADLLASMSRRFVLREFISAAQTCRAVVLNGEVIQIIGYEIAQGDFRSNAGGVITRCKANLPEAAMLDAVRAVDCVGMYCGAVDLLIDNCGRHYVIEMNLPFGLSHEDYATAEAMVGFLVTRGHKILNGDAPMLSPSLGIAGE